MSISVIKSVSAPSVHSGYWAQSGVIQIQFKPLTLPDALDYLLLKTRNVTKNLFIYLFIYLFFF